MRRIACLVALVAACGGSTPPASPAPVQSEIDAAAAKSVAPSASPAASVAPSAAPSAPPPATASAAPPQALPSGTDVVDPQLAACGEAQMAFEQKIRPDIKKCFFAEKVKNPKLTGNVKIVVNVSPKGDVSSINIGDKTELGASAVACMTKVVKDAKLDGAPCKGKTISMAEAFGNAAK